MIASLPMYWRPETADMWRAFWRHVQEQIDIPDLTPPEDLPKDWADHWLSEDLVLSQTCSLPFRTFLRLKVTYIGTLDYGLEGPYGHYHSWLIKRKGADIPADATLAHNGRDSQSGWAVAQMKDAPPYVREIETGAHANSLIAVAEGQADFAYIDAVTWRLLERSSPSTKEVEIIGRSISTPGLPLIAAAGQDPIPLRTAFSRAVEAFQPNEPEAMGGPLSFVVLPEAAYFDLETPKGAKGTD